MMKPIKHINFKINQSAALFELEYFRGAAKTYEEERGLVEGWDIIRGIELPYGKKLAQQLNVPYASPRYYILAPNIEIPVHTDVDTKCSLNFILGDDEPAPVYYPEYGDYLYTSALIDTTQPHGVKNSSKERLLLKLSIKDKTFEEVVRELRELLYD